MGLILLPASRIQQQKIECHEDTLWIGCVATSAEQSTFRTSQRLGGLVDSLFVNMTASGYRSCKKSSLSQTRIDDLFQAYGAKPNKILVNPFES